MKVPITVCFIAMFCSVMTPVMAGMTGETQTTPTAIQPFKPPVSSSSSVILLLNGSRGSKLEACGCRGHNMGGVDKEATMIRGFREVTSAVLALDCGGIFREFVTPNLKLQTYYLLKSLGEMRYDAINIGYPELAQGLDRVTAIGSSFDLPFISANIVDGTTSQPIFPSFKTFELRQSPGVVARVCVVGVTAASSKVSRAQDAASTPTATDSRGGAAMDAAGGTNAAIEFATTTSPASQARKRYVAMDEIEALRALVPTLRPKADILVLLAYATPARAKQIATEVPGFDLVVAGDYLTRTQPFRVQDSQTYIAPLESGGKFLGMAEFAPDSSARLVLREPDLLPVEQFYASSPQLLENLHAYRRDVTKLPGTSGHQAGPRSYVGATRCASCHRPEYDQWRKTRHWGAMATLARQNMQYTPDCLRCHTVAYGTPGGFRDLRLTPNLSGVQCESCHGPGANHIQEENLRAQVSNKSTTSTRTAIMRTRFDAGFCMECHDTDNDPEFDFAKRMESVRHKPPPTQ